MTLLSLHRDSFHIEDFVQEFFLSCRQAMTDKQQTIGDKKGFFEIATLHKPSNK